MSAGIVYRDVFIGGYASSALTMARPIANIRQ